MDGEAGGLVRGMNLGGLSAIDRLAVRVAAVAVIVAALTVAWGNTTRTTSATAGDLPGVYRENLITGAAEFCLFAPDGSARCFAHRPAA